MGKIALAAGVPKVHGKVTVTFPDGTRTFASEDAANAAVGEGKVVHRRGGFFVETGSVHSADGLVDSPTAAAPVATAPAPRKAPIQLPKTVSKKNTRPS